MKLYDGGIIFILLMVMVVAVGVLSDRFLGDDNVVEESSEAILSDQIGLNIDLSPKSKEKRW